MTLESLVRSMRLLTTGRNGHFFVPVVVLLILWFAVIAPEKREFAAYQTRILGRQEQLVDRQEQLVSRMDDLVREVISRHARVAGGVTHGP